MLQGCTGERLARRLIATTVALLGLAVAVGTAEAANTGFVRAQGTQFTLNGAPFYFAGTNAYYLMVSAAFGSPGYTDDTLAMASQLGFTVLRAWAFYDGGSDGLALQPAPGVYNEASFRALDYVLYKADLAGVRLLLPLVNGHPADYGGAAQYVAWCAPGSSLLAFYQNASCRQIYRNYVSYVLNRVNTYNGRRYKDDPTVFAWELANEPELPDNVDNSGQGIRAWVAEMAAFIKSIDGSHLVGTGESGYDVTAAGYSPLASAYSNQAFLLNGIKGVAFTQNTADPNVDFGSIHLYPEYWNLGAAAGSTWIADHARIARSLGKPLVVGEYGASSNAVATYGAWLQTVETEQVAGSIVWQLMCAACYGMRDQFGVAYPPAGAVSDLLAQAAATANAKAGLPTAPPPAPPTAPPTSPPAPGTMPFGVFVAAGNLDGSGPAEIVTGADAGGSPHVRTFRSDNSDFGASFMAYDASFAGGVRVAACDVDGDGVDDLITAAGPGGGPHVRVFSLAGGFRELFGFYAYDPTFAGGVFVACGDIDGDGRAEIVTSAGAGGGPHVRVWKLDGAALVELAGFYAYDPTFAGGVHVAIGDLDGDGRADIVTAAGPGGGPHVRAFSLAGGLRELASFYAYDPAFTGGVYVAAADLTGDGRAQIVTGAGPGGGPHVRVFAGTGADTGVGFYAYDPSFSGGVRVGIVDLGGGSRGIVTAAGPGGGPHVKVFSGIGAATSTSFMAY